MRTRGLCKFRANRTFICKLKIVINNRVCVFITIPTNKSDVVNGIIINNKFYKLYIVRNENLIMFIEKWRMP